MASPFQVRRRSQSEHEPYHACAKDYAHNLLLGTPLLKLASSHHELRNRLLAEVLLRRSTNQLRTLDDLPPSQLERRYAQFVASGEPRPPSATAEPASHNLALVSRIFELNQTERSILQLVLAMNSGRDLRSLLEAFHDVSIAKAAEIVAVAAKLKTEDARRALRPGSRLVDSAPKLCASQEVQAAFAHD